MDSPGSISPSDSDDVVEECLDNDFTVSVHDPSFGKAMVNDKGEKKLSNFAESDSTKNVVVMESHSSEEYATSVPEKPYFLKGNNMVLLEPEVGMIFQSEDEAFEFYNMYAKKKGFSVRKGHLAKRKDGSIRVRIFLCSNEGMRQNNRIHAARKPRMNERTNCKARIEFKVDKDNAWTVRKINIDHNHLLAKPNKSFMLRSHRKMWRSQLGAVNEVEVVEAPEEDTATEIHMQRSRNLEKEDAQVLLDFMKARQSADPSFFYAVQLDDSGQLANLFWADARSKLDYTYFGDSVVFDTTYRLSNFDLPFAPFLGVNHHKQAVVFGAAFLLDETMESFVWVFRTFLSAMSGRQPSTVLIEHCELIEKAISMVYPYAHHRFCFWHFYRNCMRKLAHLCSKNPYFLKEFKDCLYKVGYEEIQNGWVNLIKKYDLNEVSWVKEIQGAQNLNENSFCATMMTSEWCETMDHLFNKYFNRKLPFSKFIEQYHKAVIRFREKELFEDYKSRQSKPVLLANVAMLTQAAESYTRLIYADFEEEFKYQFACLCEPIIADGALTFKVSMSKKCSYGIVEFNPSGIIVSCSCKKFERLGILCMHVLKVLNNNNILTLPPQFIIPRWTKFAKNGIIVHPSIVNTDVQEPWSSHFAIVSHKAIAVAIKSSVSEDAMDVLERGLDRLIDEVDCVLHDIRRHKEGVGRKGQTKVVSKKRKRRRRDRNVTNTRSDAGPSHDLLHAKVQSDNVADGLMIDEQTNAPPYNREDIPSTFFTMPTQPFTSFPSESIIPNQGTFTASQDVFAHSLQTRHATGHSVTSSNIVESVSGNAPIMQSQSNMYSNWEAQPLSIPNIVVTQHDLDSSMHSNVLTKPQTSQNKLNLDINKGS